MCLIKYLREREKNKNPRILTAKCNTGSSNNTGLNDGVFLSSERLLKNSRFLEKFSPRFDEKEAQKSSRNIERRNNTSGETQFQYNESEKNPQYETHTKSP